MNDWIEWHGGECPVPAGERIDIRFRGGTYEDYQPSEGWRWTHVGGAYDIVAYRISKPAEPPKPDTSAEDALWHGYAQAVLGVFVRFAPSGGTIDEVTNSAAAVADAMIAEAKKRGRV